MSGSDMELGYVMDDGNRNSIREKSEEVEGLA